MRQIRSRSKLRRGPPRLSSQPPPQGHRMSAPGWTVLAQLGQPRGSAGGDGDPGTLGLHLPPGALCSYSTATAPPFLFPFFPQGRRPGVDLLAGSLRAPGRITRAQPPARDAAQLRGSSCLLLLCLVSALSSSSGCGALSAPGPLISVTFPAHQGLGA